MCHAVYAVAFSIIEILSLLPWGLLNNKTSKFIVGHRFSFPKNLQTNTQYVWLHVSSSGELEQALPFLEKHLTQYPDQQVMVSYFSLSCQPFLKHVPKLAAAFPLCWDHGLISMWLFYRYRIDYLLCVRYDLWWHVLSLARLFKTKIVLLNATFAYKFQVKNKYSRRWFLFLVSYFDTLYVTSTQEKLFFTQHTRVPVAYLPDGKWQRVVQRSARATIDPNSILFVLTQSPYLQNKKIVVWASFHSTEWELFLLWQATQPADVVALCVPHDISPKKISGCLTDLHAHNIVFTQISTVSTSMALPKSPVYFIDAIGFLAELYRLAHVVILGGGFDGKLHNSLEPAVYGCQTIIGPMHQFFPEVPYLINQKLVTTTPQDTLIQTTNTMLLDSLDVWQVQKVANQKKFMDLFLDKFN
jgi:3-deoxy-D-manno-octulosonic-acid transferase